MALEVTEAELSAALAAGKFAPAAPIAYEAYGLDFATAISDMIDEGHPAELLIDRDAAPASDDVMLWLIEATETSITLAVHIPEGAHAALGEPGFYAYWINESGVGSCAFAAQRKGD